MKQARSRAAPAAPNPQVTLRQGPLWGSNMQTRKGRAFCAFQGIPYAKPPVGELRFKPPQEHRGWTGSRAARLEGNKCVQTDFVTQQLMGKEDCLYLNVYTPKVKQEGAGLPVMVWVHGGGFFAGSGSTDLYGPDLLLDENVVLVTFNYRLGVLGFLSLGTKECSGNYGLKDQVAALRWVQKNIYKFGGNPNSVTIFGESAGGASVHYLLLSPLARGLFHRAIAMSGSAHNDWALERDPLGQAREFAARLGCKQTSETAIIEFLRGADASELAETEKLIREEKKKLTHFVPTVEPEGTPGAFITADPRAMLTWGQISDVPLMVGSTTHEGMLTYGMRQTRGGSMNLAESASRGVPQELGLASTSPQYKKAARAIEDFYRRLVPGDGDEQFIHLNSDVDFTKGLDELVRGFAALRRSPVFYYQFSYDGSLKLTKKLFQIERKGTAHADELGYLFSRSMLEGELDVATPEDHRAIDRMLKLWTNFARTGHPTPDTSLGVHWESVMAPLHGPNMADTRFLDIGSSLVMHRENLNEERTAFWRRLVQQVREMQRGKL